MAGVVLFDRLGSYSSSPHDVLPEAVPLTRQVNSPGGEQAHSPAPGFVSVYIRYFEQNIVADGGWLHAGVGVSRATTPVPDFGDGVGGLSVAWRTILPYWAIAAACAILPGWWSAAPSAEHRSWRPRTMRRVRLRPSRLAGPVPRVRSGSLLEGRHCLITWSARGVNDFPTSKLQSLSSVDLEEKRAPHCFRTRQLAHLIARRILRAWEAGYEANFSGEIRKAVAESEGNLYRTDVRCAAPSLHQRSPSSDGSSRRMHAIGHA